MAMPAWTTMILPVAYKCLNLAVKIAEIIKSQGIDAAGEMRLKDIDGWKEWSAEMLKEEGKLRFINQLLKLKEDLEDE